MTKGAGLFGPDREPILVGFDDISLNAPDSWQTKAGRRKNEAKIRKANRFRPTRLAKGSGVSEVLQRAMAATRKSRLAKGSGLDIARVAGKIRVPQSAIGKR